MLIVDAHADLAWNMFTFGRDYRRSAAETRRRELGTEIIQYNDDTLLGWTDYQLGRVALVFASLFAAPIRRRAGDWEMLCYRNAEQAYLMYRSQLDAYRRLAQESQGKFRLVQNQAHLRDLLAHWGRETEEGHPVGLVLLMEGAEGIGDLSELSAWRQGGLRLIGPAWAGTRFCGGTREPGELTAEGFALLEAMADFNFVLDLTHMDERAALQALDFYPGSIVATHANALALLKGVESNRHLSDRLIRGLLERQGVIGIVPYNAFLVAGWRRGDRREAASLEHVVAHIDYICQMAGDARHVGLGSDFDGGFGLQSVPPGIETVADLQKLAGLLADRGYAEEDIAAVLGENWLNLLYQTLPEEG